TIGDHGCFPPARSVYSTSLWWSRKIDGGKNRAGNAYSRRRLRHASEPRPKPIRITEPASGAAEIAPSLNTTLSSPILSVFPPSPVVSTRMVIVELVHVPLKVRCVGFEPSGIPRFVSEKRTLLDASST